MRASTSYGAGTWARRALAVGAVLALAGCQGGEDIAAPDEMLSAEDAGELAMTLSDQGDETVTSQGEAAAGAASASGASAGLREHEVSFESRRDCLGGGEVRVEGTVLHTFDPETRTRTIDVDAEKIHRSCGVRIRGRTVRLTGDPALELTAGRKRVAGVLTGSQTASLRGDLIVETADGDTRPCRVDIEWTLLPEENTRTVEGAVCGYEFERTVTWNPSS